MLWHFNKNLKMALESALPELQPVTLNSTFLTHVRIELTIPFKDYKPKEHWQDLSNCRNFFDTYANEIGINPCHAASWDEIRMNDMTKRKVGLGLPPPPPPHHSTP